MRPLPELEFKLYAPATSGAQRGQDAVGCMLIFLLMEATFQEIIPSCLHSTQKVGREFAPGLGDHSG